MPEEENQAKGSAADDGKFQERIAMLLKRIESETGGMTKQKADMPKKHTGLKLLLAALLMGGAATFGAYQPDAVKSVTEPIYQEIVRPAVDAASRWCNESCGTKANAAESYNGK